MPGYKVLQIDGSARYAGSVTRQLTDRFVEQMNAAGMLGSLKVRDTAAGFDFITEDWIGANFTDETQRSPQQNELLAASDLLVGEIEAADLLVIGLPVYNFGVPAAMKAWIDMVVRARKTFKYTDEGPVGLLNGKKAVIVAASGGTEAGSSVDFATSYMKHILGFMGINDVEIIAADGLMMDAEAAMSKAQAGIDAYFQPIAA